MWQIMMGLTLWLGCSACDPFTASGLATDQDVVIPQSEVGKVELLVPGRRLPPSARNVRVERKDFQDTSLRVRFEANTAEARAFAEKIIGRRLAKGGYAYMATRSGPDWWISEEQLQRAELGEDRTVDGDGMPAVGIAMLPSGETATVWIYTFTT